MQLSVRKAVCQRGLKPVTQSVNPDVNSQSFGLLFSQILETRETGTKRGIPQGLCHANTCRSIPDIECLHSVSAITRTSTIIGDLNRTIPIVTLAQVDKGSQTNLWERQHRERHAVKPPPPFFKDPLV